MPVAEAQERISAAEFAEWMAHYNDDPFGEERADLRAGIVAAAAVNVWVKRGQRAAKAADFMPRFGAEADQPAAGQSVAEMKARLRLASDMFKKRKKGQEQKGARKKGRKKGAGRGRPR